MRKTIGQLECLIRPGEDDKRVVLLLHGFGADANDLFPLAAFLDPEEKLTFVFPNAPLEVPIGPMWTGRGWFPISLRDLETGIDFTKIRPPGLDGSTAKIGDLIFHLEPEELVIGGFSQGAMVALNYVLENPGAAKGVILLSGALLDEDGWRKRASALKGLRFIQSHGQQDQVIPFSVAQKLHEVLKNAGWDGQFLGFSGAHEIPPAVLIKCRDFIRSVLP